MAPTQGYQPRNEEEANELAEYKRLWKNKGMDFNHFETDHKKRAKWISVALKRGFPLRPSDFGKLKWYEDGVCY
jgi:hypothetical protein